MKVFIGADHRGFALKEKIKPWLSRLGHDVVDCGNTVYEKTDDYPDFSFAVADRVVSSVNSRPGLEVRGIVICGSGVGVTIAANKVKGARCSTGIVASEIILGREDDDMNILAISANYTKETKAKEMITVFLNTPFKGDERHTRRLKKIFAREKNL